MKIVKKIRLGSKDYYALNAQGFYREKVVNELINIDDFNSELLSAAVFHSTNKIRRELGLPLFIHNSKLQDAAVIHSVQMKVHDFLAHDNPFNAIYKTLRDRVDSINMEGTFTSLGENLASSPHVNAGDRKYVVKSFLDKNEYYALDGMKKLPLFNYSGLADSLLNGWMGSEGHRLNIINQQFQFLGCASILVIHTSKLTQKAPEIKVVQNFGGAQINALNIKKIKRKISIIKK